MIERPPRSVTRAPSFWNVDLSVQKNVAVSRGMQLQLRVEAFNVFNNINDGNPNVDITNANFGRITTMAGRPRMIQFGVRFVY